MNTPQLSIIIPAFNAERYLGLCLDSLMRQTYQDWQLILIDDGSSDSTPEICDSYAKRDSRIRAIHVENSGPAHVRNIGLQMADGEYVTFMDADDEYGDETTLDQNMSILTADPTIDFLQFPFRRVFLDNTEGHVSSFGSYVVNSSAGILEQMADRKICGYLWHKIFKATVIKDLVFPEHLILTEDLWLLIDLAKRCKRFYMSDMGYYKYYERSNSIVTRKTQKKETQALITYKKLCEVLSENEAVSERSKANWFFFSISQVVNVNSLWEGDLQYWANQYKPYVPSMRLVMSCLRISFKLKVLMIHALGLERFLERKVKSRKRKIARRARR